jgi:hypothetical protein
MNKIDIDTRLFQKTAHIKEGLNQLENWRYFERYGGVKSHKSHLQEWLITQKEARLEIGLTLMPLKVLSCGQRPDIDDASSYRRHMTKNELTQAGYKFAEILNKLSYRKAYERHNKCLFIVMVLEGEKSQKDLHLHFASNKPEHLSHFEFRKVVRRAIEMSRDFCLHNPKAKSDAATNERYQYKADIIDSGWIGYITKELDSQQIHNLYFPCKSVSPSRMTLTN